jgi:HK97 family phage major capsid protein
MEETATEVAAAAVDPKPHVEAARPTTPYITTNLRALDGMTAGSFARHQLEATKGNQDSAMIVRAALDDNTTTTAAGLIPTRFLREVIGVLDTTRPFIDSLTREALPGEGMEFKIPRRTARASVAEQAAQGDEVSSDEPTYDFLTVQVKTFAGGERISRQLIERSDPAFLDRLFLEMASEYAQKVDNFAWLTVANALGAGSNSDGGSITEAIGQAIADSWSVMRFAPNNLAVAPSTTGSFGFADLLKAVDSDERPIFSASGQLVNQAGNIVVPNAQGSVMGLRLVVDGNMAGDSNALVYPSAAACFYEVPGAPVSISVQDVSTLEVEVAVYGYVGMAVKYPTAIRYLTVTP